MELKCVHNNTTASTIVITVSLLGHLIFLNKLFLVLFCQIHNGFLITDCL